MDQIGMDLPQGDERPRMLPAYSEFPQKSRAVARDGNVRVVLRKSEIETFAAIYARSAAHARRKAMYEPGQSFQAIRMKGNNL